MYYERSITPFLGDFPRYILEYEQYPRTRLNISINTQIGPTFTPPVLASFSTLFPVPLKFSN
jgi:hypothetical protein